MLRTFVSLREAIRPRPSARSLLNLGRDLYRKDQLDDARTCFSKAIELDPDFAIAHIRLGFVLLGLGHVEESIASVRRAIELEPDCGMIYVVLAIVLYKNGQLDDAIAACRKATELSPDRAEAHRELGNMLREAGHEQEAQRELDESERLRSSD